MAEDGPAPAATPRRPALLLDPTLGPLLATTAVSWIGSQVTVTVIPLLVFSITGRAADIAWVAGLAAVPPIALVTVAARLVSKHSKGRILWVTNVIQGLGALAIVFTRGLPAIIVALLVMRAAAAVSRPALQALTPALAGDRLTAYIGYRGALNFTSQALGPALGGVLVATVGARTAVLADAASFFVAAAAFLTLPGIRAASRTGPDQAAGTGKSSRGRWSDVFRDVLRNPPVRTLNTFWFVQLAVLPLFTVAAVPMIERVFREPAAFYGYGAALWAIGSVAGSLVGGKIKYGRAGGWLLLSGLLYGLCTVGMGLSPDYWIFAALWTAFGFVYGPESVVGQLALYAVTPQDRLAHVFSAVNATQSAATLIGYAVTAGLIDLIGVRTSIVTAGILFALASLFCFGLASGGRQLRQLTI